MSLFHIGLLVGFGIGIMAGAVFIMILDLIRYGR